MGLSSQPLRETSSRDFHMVHWSQVNSAPDVLEKSFYGRKDRDLNCVTNWSTKLKLFWMYQHTETKIKIINQHEYKKSIQRCSKTECICLCMTVPNIQNKHRKSKRCVKGGRRERRKERCSTLDVEGSLF